MLGLNDGECDLANAMPADQIRVSAKKAWQRIEYKRKSARKLP
jgi:hypothetical protein